MVEWLKAPVLKTGDARASVGSNPTLSATQQNRPDGRFLLCRHEYWQSGIRKAALGNMPVACCNQPGFSAEKESHSLRHTTKPPRRAVFVISAWILAEWDSKGGCENAVIPNEAEASQGEPAVRIPRRPFAAPGTAEWLLLGRLTFSYTGAANHGERYNEKFHTGLTRREWNHQ